MYGYRRCSVEGCEDKYSPRHLFPNSNKFPEVFGRWIDLCANDELKKLDAEYVYRTKRVCHVHFTARDIASNIFLRKDAIPSLQLPGRQSIILEQSEDLQSSSRSPFQLIVQQKHTEPQKDCIQPRASTSREEVVQDVTITRKRAFSVLEEVGVTSAKKLSPKSRKFYKTNIMLRKSLRRVKRNLALKRKHVFTKSEVIHRATFGLEPHVAEFVRSQIRLCGTHSKGRRYTMNDKCLALILYKQSPKAYRTFSKLFNVPTRKTITTLLEHIPLGAGITSHILKALKDVVISFKPAERLSILLFDEMSIQPHISFNRRNMCFEGFEDLGDTSSNQIADHAIVFMLRGVTKNWKQPIAFGFSKNSIKSIDLVRMIKNIITECNNIGLKIIASVSDQGSSNVAAINYLMKYSVVEADYPNRKCYKVCNQIIYHIFDPPHLIKGIRNNLLTKDLVWKDNDDINVAKWDDIYSAYQLDNSSAELRLMPKLTEEHCNPEKIRKMKVANATQVFSHSVAAAINIFVKIGSSNTATSLSPSAIGTAKVIKFFDKLFDSVNGSTLYPQYGKTLRCALSKNSKHEEFFAIAKEALRNMYFQKGNVKYVPPSLKNWIGTIHALEDIFQNLQGRISFLKLRMFNQDPIENFFGQIRQRGVRNVNPTVTQFQSHFKSLILNNLTSKHSVHANCEEDSSNILTNVRNFINVREDRNNDISAVGEEISVTINSLAFSTTKVDALAISYISGFLCKRLRTLYSCESCKRNLLCKNTRDEWHQFIQAKEFATDVPPRLTYATPQLIEGLLTAYSVIKIVLPEIAAKKTGVLTLLNILNDNVDFDFINNCIHVADIKKKIIKDFCMLTAYNWTIGINRILNGKEKRYKGNDPIFKAALTFVTKK